MLQQYVGPFHGCRKTRKNFSCAALPMRLLPMLARRRVVSSLMARGVLASDSLRAPFRFVFPAALASGSVSGLFPERPQPNLRENGVACPLIEDRYPLVFSAISCYQELEISNQCCIKSILPSVRRHLQAGMLDAFVKSFILFLITSKSCATSTVTRSLSIGCILRSLIFSNSATFLFASPSNSQITAISVADIVHGRSWIARSAIWTCGFFNRSSANSMPVAVPY